MGNSTSAGEGKSSWTRIVPARSPRGNPTSATPAKVEIGAGTLRLDLFGTPAKGYSVRIRGGIGEVTVHLPKDVGISASARGGLGEISATGLHKNGNLCVNDSSETAKAKIVWISTAAWAPFD